MSIDGLRNFATSVRIYQRNLQDRKWEPEAPYMKEVVKKGDICLHFGGSDGRHSYLLSHHVGPEGRVQRELDWARIEGGRPQPIGATTAPLPSVP